MEISYNNIRRRKNCIVMLEPITFKYIFLYSYSGSNLFFVWNQNQTQLDVLQIISRSFVWSTSIFHNKKQFVKDMSNYGSSFDLIYIYANVFYVFVHEISIFVLTWISCRNSVSSNKIILTDMVLEDRQKQYIVATTFIPIKKLFFLCIQAKFTNSIKLDRTSLFIFYFIVPPNEAIKLFFQILMNIILNCK